MRKTLLILSLGLFFLIQAGGICWSQTTTRVSVDSADTAGNNASNYPSISADGRYVSFQSSADNLLGPGNDTNGKADVFVRDRDADGNGTYDEPGPIGVSTVRVSVHSDGTEGDQDSTLPSISADGRYVAFESLATDLVAGDANDFSDIFVRDRDADGNGTYDEVGPIGVSTVRVSVHSDGTESMDPSHNPSISADGRYVAFDSDGGLVAGDSAQYYDIFVRDLVAARTTRMSVDSGGNEGNAHSYSPSISGDGRYVAFESSATNLVPSGSNGFIHIFVHDRDADGDGIYDEVGGISTVQVSVDSAGSTEGNRDSSAPSISVDGRYVAFESIADNLVPDDTPFPAGFIDIFVHDRDADGNGTYDEVGGVSTIRVSVASGGAEGNGHSYSPSISVDGRYVAFYSEANNLVANDLNSSTDVFVHDRDADGNGTYDEVGGVSTIRVSVASGGAEAHGDSTAPSISSNGRYVAFASVAADLVTGDGNGISDIFTYERESLPTVNSTSPADNANGVAVESSITATFSEPMNESTIDVNTFTLDNGVTGTVSYDANTTTARFTPTSRLQYSTGYTATITTAAQDLAGNPMLADYVWTFTTESEQNDSSGSGSCFIATSASDWADF